ncbi:hypothetical protein ACFL5N_00025 [bacterium]
MFNKKIAIILLMLFISNLFIDYSIPMYKTKQKLPLNQTLKLQTIFRGANGEKKINSELKKLFKDLIKKGEIKQEYIKELMNINNSEHQRYIRDVLEDIVKEEYEEKIFPINNVKFETLHKDLQDLIIEVGVSDDFVAMTRSAGVKSSLLFTMGLPKLIKGLGKEFVKENWDVIVELGKSAGKVSFNLFNLGLPKLKEIITKDNFKKIGEGLIKLERLAGKYKWSLFTFDLPLLIEKLGKDFVKENWDSIVELGKAVGGNQHYLFELGIPKLIAELGENFVKKNWDSIVELGKALGNNSVFLFRYGLPALKGIITEYNLMKIGKDLIQLGKSAGKNSMYLFEHGLKALIKALGALTHLEFCIDKIIKTNKLRAYNILYHFTKGLESKYINKKLDKNEQENILNFLNDFRFFDGRMFSIYKKIKNKELKWNFMRKPMKLMNHFLPKTMKLLFPEEKFVKYIKDFMENKILYSDILHTKDINEFLNNKYFKKFSEEERKEILLSLVERVSPPSIGSDNFNERLKLFNKFLKIKNVKIPEALKGKNFGGKNDFISIKKMSLKESKKQDKIIASIRKSFKGDIRKNKEKDKKDLLKNLKEYLKNINDNNKAKEFWEAFFKYASHFNILNVKGIQDYKFLIEIEDMIKDNDTKFRELFNEIFKEINEDLLPEKKGEKNENLFKIMQKIKKKKLNRLKIILSSISGSEREKFFV